jgi:hypothetical protein
MVQKILNRATQTLLEQGMKLGVLKGQSVSTLHNVHVQYAIRNNHIFE